MVAAQNRRTGTKQTNKQTNECGTREKEKNQDRNRNSVKLEGEGLLENKKE